MIWVLAYLVVGVLNYWRFAGGGGALLFREGARVEGLVELGFFVLLWPIQLAYFAVMHLGNAISALMEKIWR